MAGKGFVGLGHVPNHPIYVGVKCVEIESGIDADRQDHAS